jgi:hypothetical protein
MITKSPFLSGTFSLPCLMTRGLLHINHQGSVRRCWHVRWHGPQFPTSWSSGDRNPNKHQPNNKGLYVLYLVEARLDSQAGSSPYKSSKGSWSNLTLLIWDHHATNLGNAEHVWNHRAVSHDSSSIKTLIIPGHHLAKSSYFPAWSMIHRMNGWMSSSLMWSCFDCAESQQEQWLNINCTFSGAECMTMQISSFECSGKKEEIVQKRKKQRKERKEHREGMDIHSWVAWTV